MPELTRAIIRKIVRKQQRTIMQKGFDPTWDLFAKTLGWFQIRAELSADEQAKYQEVWVQEYAKTPFAKARQ